MNRYLRINILWDKAIKALCDDIQLFSCALPNRIVLSLVNESHSMGWPWERVSERNPTHARTHWVFSIVSEQMQHGVKKATDFRNLCACEQCVYSPKKGWDVFSGPLLWQHSRKTRSECSCCLQQTCDSPIQQARFHKLPKLLSEVSESRACL